MGAKKWSKALVIIRETKEKNKRTEYLLLNLPSSDENLRRKTDFTGVCGFSPNPNSVRNPHINNDGCHQHSNSMLTGKTLVRHRDSKNTQNHETVGVSQMTRHN